MAHMSNETVLLCYPSPGIAEVRLNRPAQLNALVPAMFDALVRIGAQLAEDGDLRAVILCGEGRAFCAGLDRSCLQGMGEGAADAGAIQPGNLVARTHGAANLFQQAVLTWRNLPVPVIAAAPGFALGGGLQLALGADVRLVTEETKLSVMEINWGLVPDMGGMVLLKELCRADTMRDLCYSGRVFLGPEAVRLGIATRVCEEPMEEAMRTAQEIATKSPKAIRAMKRLLNVAFSASPEAVLLAESAEQERLIGGAEQMEAVRARLERREAKFAVIPGGERRFPLARE